MLSQCLPRGHHNDQVTPSDPNRNAGSTDVMAVSSQHLVISCAISVNALAPHPARIAHAVVLSLHAAQLARTTSSTLNANPDAAPIEPRG